MLSGLHILYRTPPSCRFVVRDFTYTEGMAAQAADSLSQLEVEAAATLSNLREQSGRKYGEAVSAWMHIKAVRVFVESVLR
jgi:V-type H+-transporting ATPase subunit C